MTTVPQLSPRTVENKTARAISRALGYKKQLQSAIIYRGPSLIDGAPIVVVVTLTASNSKTGKVLQTYILIDGVDPRDANKTGADVSICGNCPHRGTPNNDPDRKLAKNRSCYVQIGQGPLHVHRAIERGSYPTIHGHAAIAALGAGRMARIGTYGDGAAVPSYVWDSLITYAKGHTAYSHQANVAGADYRGDLYMRSVDSLAAAQEAWRVGERTFRVVRNLSEIVKGAEILCPASKEAGRRVTCVDCKLCGGTKIKAKSIVIPAHGSGKNSVAA